MSARICVRASATYLLAVIPVTFAALLLGDFASLALDTIVPVASRPWLEPVLFLGAPVVVALAVFSFLAARLRQRGRFVPGFRAHVLRAGPLYAFLILLVAYAWVAHTSPDFWMVRTAIVFAGLVVMTGLGVDAVFAVRARPTVSGSAA